jgi:hypothetical protein
VGFTGGSVGLPPLPVVASAAPLAPADDVDWLAAAASPDSAGSGVAPTAPSDAPGVEEPAGGAEPLAAGLEPDVAFGAELDAVVGAAVRAAVGAAVGAVVGVPGVFVGVGVLVGAGVGGGAVGGGGVAILSKTATRVRCWSIVTPHVGEVL